MATAAQIDANRLNSQKSTGPRSDEGKAASKFNALKHGIDANSPVLPSEDIAKCETLIDEYHERFCPSTPVERFLVATMIEAHWNRRRFQAIETQLMNQMLAAMDADTGYPLAKLFDPDNPASRQLERVIRHREAAERSWHRAYNRMLKEIDARPIALTPPPVQPFTNPPERTQSVPPLQSVRRPEPPENLALRL